MSDLSKSENVKSDARQQRGQQGEDEAVRFLETYGFVMVARNWRPGQNNAAQNPHRNAVASDIEYSKLVAKSSAKRVAAADGAMRGEIDIIAWQTQGAKRILCFIEVKTRRADATGVWSRGAPQEAVTFAKQKQISRLANAYVSFHRLHDVPCRFDVVEVWHQQDRAPRIEHHISAFDYVDPSYGARLASRHRRF